MIYFVGVTRVIVNVQRAYFCFSTHFCHNARNSVVEPLVFFSFGYKNRQCLIIHRGRSLSSGLKPRSRKPGFCNDFIFTTSSGRKIISLPPIFWLLNNSPGSILRSTPSVEFSGSRTATICTRFEMITSLVLRNI